MKKNRCLSLVSKLQRKIFGDAIDEKLHRLPMGQLRDLSFRTKLASLYIKPTYDVSCINERAEFNSCVLNFSICIHEGIEAPG